MRALGQRVPAQRIGGREAELRQGLDDHLGIKNPHHQFFAEDGRQRGQAQLDFLALRRTGFDAAIERTTFFDHVHATQQLDARGHRNHHRGRHLIDLVQHAIDTKADRAEVALGFEMDVRGALFERVLPQPVNDVDDVLVVRIDLPVALSEFDQLLEIMTRGDVLAIELVGALDRFGQCKKLCGVLRNIERAGDYQSHAAAGDLGDLGQPVGRKRLGRRDNQLGRRQLDRQDMEARRIAGRHHVGDFGEVDFQRVDAIERQVDFAGHPFGEHVQRQRAVRWQCRGQLRLRHGRQRMHGQRGIAQDALCGGEARLDVGFFDDAVSQ
ncbi:hypothetical protein IMCC9480_3806 [Oxalobacteraceae bacterium IMCC9480]|nr:hypothetical protein IMCC9480_3806 [Oxalobacteraceae bacterium IMCC9480]